MRTSARGGLQAALVLGLAITLAACGGGSGSAAADSADDAPMSPQAVLGQKIFADVSLSASGKQACASCHAPADGHAPDNALAVQLGGINGDQQGQRNSPGINYLSFDTPFYFAADGTPTGGFFWDGRATSLQDQAGGPLLNSVEMANASKADLVARLARTNYANDFKTVFGADIFSRADDAFDRVTLALQMYEKEDVDFRPFSSKYDQFLRGTVSLTTAELRGLAWFNSPVKGNCAACHPSAKGADGSLPLFTDFTFDNLGVPRNPAILANADPAYYDLGLCQRADLTARTDLCGAFKVPSLRNVALRKALFHNGRFANLKDALTFYVQRDTNPEKFYPRSADGTVDKFDDLPPQFRGNVNTLEVPYNRHLGDAPALSDAEIDDVVLFLQTLTDGYK